MADQSKSPHTIHTVLEAIERSRMAALCTEDEGVALFHRALAEQSNEAESFVELLVDDPLFEALSSSLSVVTFRCLPGNLRGVRNAEQVRWTKRLMMAH